MNRDTNSALPESSINKEYDVAEYPKFIFMVWLFEWISFDFD